MYSKNLLLVQMIQHMTLVSYFFYSYNIYLLLEYLFFSGDDCYEDSETEDANEYKPNFCKLIT